MSTMRGVEWRQSDQPMNAAFCFEVTIRIGAPNFNRHALESGLFTRSLVENIDLEAPSLAPAKVHSQQHLSPVLGFSTAGASVYCDDSWASVVLATEGQLELECVKPSQEGGNRLIDLVYEIRIRIGVDELEQVSVIVG